jgi:DnaJ like chaperone protein
MNGGSVTEMHSGKVWKAGSRNLMAWTGKIIGAALGYLLGPVGAAVGFLLGHQYDLQAAQAGSESGSADPQQISAALFEAAFAVMGHVAKADGHVSNMEIEAARSIMRQLRLDEAHVRLAIDAFTRGKAADYPLHATLDHLRQLCRWRPDLLRFFMETQLRAALLGNDLVGPSRDLLWAVGARLGIPSAECVLLEHLLRQQRGYTGSQAPPAAGVRLQNAYETLGITTSASDAEVKKAYRRLMSENHPDKLVSRGLPESMQELAKEKTQRIREAYEIISESRGLR